MAVDSGSWSNRSEESQKKRRRRTREESADDLLVAAVRLLARNGALGGLSLRDVATEAGVNHGQIYTYFGDRRTLLRSAIGRLLDQAPVDEGMHWVRRFADRRLAALKYWLDHPMLLQLMALLALDGDDEFHVFPLLEETRSSLAQDVETGALASDVDPMGAHVATAAAIFGYGIFRNAFARDLGIAPDALDERMTASFKRMLAGFAHNQSRPLGSDGLAAECVVAQSDQIPRSG